MLDIKFIRDNPEIVKEAVKNKKANVDVDELLEIDKKRRQIMESSESLKAEQNSKSKGPQSPEGIEELKKIKEKFKELEGGLTEIEKKFHEIMLKVPNIPSEDTPVGVDESGNKVIRQVGKISGFPFKPKEHWELGQELDILDSERAAKVSGARFVYMKGGLALMEFALMQYALSVLTDSGQLKKIIKKAKLDVPDTPFIPVLPPVFIKPDVFQKMGRLEPKEERYHISSDNLYLIGSAEHTLGSMHMDEFIKIENLPLRYVGFSTAFRREAGSYGKDMKGMLRVHQFDKLEMESFTLPEDSVKEQDFIVAIQEYMIQDLELPYQVVAICSGDMGAPDARQIDIETWMPGQNKYRETHTSDLMTDFQSRRLAIKFKRDNKSEFVHMNDATAFAGRTLIAIMENYQTEKGTVKIPKVLQKYMGGLEAIQ
ncbi:MAG: serine--tRNA ligase [Candidatus Yanofskybacteria bacterium]|nr:serine--tRNA ligase [Candidatus Yanofskybacteria bacterium]